MKYFLHFGFYFVLLRFGGYPYVDATPDAKKLLNDLLADYNVDVRPVEKEKDNVTVKIGITIMKLVNVDEANGHLEAEIWLNIEWNDFNLKWDPTKYGGIKSYPIPADKIWIPDIYAYNQLGEFQHNHNTHAVVKKDGNVSYIPPSRFTTYCPMSLLHYPFDEHKCDLKLGSWTSDGLRMDLQLQSEDGGDMSSFAKNTEWNLISVPAVRNAIIYSCCPEPYVDITFSLNIRRRGDSILSLAHSIDFVICSMILLSCLLPPSSTLKVILAMCSMGLCAYSGSIFNIRPGDEVPYLVTYFMRLLVINFVVFSMHVVVICFYSKVGAMPSFVKHLMDKCQIYISGPPNNDSAEMNVSPDEPPFNDVQELTSQHSHRVSQRFKPSKRMTDWECLGILLDKCLFLFWICFILIFAFSAFPSFTSE